MNASKSKYTDDIKRVAEELDQNSVSRSEYREHGEWTPSTIRRRFGSWSDGVREAGLEAIEPPDPITREQALADLRRVNDEVGRPAKQAEYREIGEHSVSALYRLYGSFREAQAELGHEVSQGPYPER